jgi:hypothetical protein
VYVDGALVSTIDLYSSSNKPRTAVFTQSVTPGEHTLQVQALGTKRGASKCTRVSVDAFFVLPLETASTPRHAGRAKTGVTTIPR